MVIDTSAVIAILQQEEEAQHFAELIAADRYRLISAVSHLESAIVIGSRYGVHWARATGCSSSYPHNLNYPIYPSSSRSRQNCLFFLRQRPPSCSVEHGRLLFLCFSEDNRGATPIQRQ